MKSVFAALVMTLLAGVVQAQSPEQSPDQASGQGQIRILQPGVVANIGGTFVACSSGQGASAPAQAVPPRCELGGAAKLNGVKYRYIVYVDRVATFGAQYQADAVRKVQELRVAGTCL